MAEKRQKWREWAENGENQGVLAAWARAGMPDSEIAKRIGISRSTLGEWKRKYPEIQKALNTGAEFADSLVENSLYKKAVGFYVMEQKAFKVKTVEYNEDGKRVRESEELQLAEERHYIEPDIKAIIFWLKNRKPDVWKEKIVEGAGDDEGTGIVVLTPAQIEQIANEVKDDKTD